LQKRPCQQSSGEDFFFFLTAASRLVSVWGHLVVGHSVLGLPTEDCSKLAAAAAASPSSAAAAIKALPGTINALHVWPNREGTLRCHCWDSKRWLIWVLFLRCFHFVCSYS
jgi:hypothetical protein